jgi:hypothetical protein
MPPRHMGWRLIVLNVNINQYSYRNKKISTAFCRRYTRYGQCSAGSSGQVTVTP